MSIPCSCHSHATHCLSLSLVIISMSTSFTPLHHARWYLPWPETSTTLAKRRAPRTPSTCHDAHGHDAERTRALPRPVASVLLSLSPCAHALHTAPGHPQTPPLDVARAVDLVIVNLCRHGTARTPTSPARLRPPFSVPSRASCSP
jgi:hypothetical protein